MLDPIYSIIASAGISAAITATSLIILHVMKIYNKKKNLLDDGELICKDLHTILSRDVISDDEDEMYEVDLSLKSYFVDNNVKLQNLANEFYNFRTLFGRKDNTMNSIGGLFEWLIHNFYNINFEEEERIRIWAKNTTNFFNMYNDAFQYKKHIKIPS